MPDTFCAYLAGTHVTGVNYREVKGSPQEAFTGSTLRVRRVFDCAWEDRWDLARVLVGFSFREHIIGQPYPDGTERFAVYRETPSEYADWPEINKGHLWATSIDSIEGIGPLDAGDNDVYDYTIARLTVTYETLPYAVRFDEDISPPNLDAVINLHKSGFVPPFNPGDPPPGGPAPFPDESMLLRYVTKIIQPSAEAFTLPYGSFYWHNPLFEDPTFVGPVPLTPVVGSHSVIISTAEVHYIWHQVPGRPSAMTTQLGTVNDDWFDGYAPGTLLLLAAEFKPYKQIDGTRVCDITYKCKHFSARERGADGRLIPQNPEKGHNYFLRYFGANGLPELRYYLITDTGRATGKTVFAKSNFLQLFNPDEAVLFQDDSD